MILQKLKMDDIMILMSKKLFNQDSPNISLLRLFKILISLKSLC